MTTPAVIYRRISRDKNETGLGLDAQYDTCSTFAGSRGWDPVAVFTDRDISGAVPLRDRPAGAQAAELARALGAVLLVARMDRIGRDAVDRMQVLRAAADEGWRLEAPDVSGIDPETPEGRLIHGMLANVAEYEREVGRARTRAALRAKLRRGERVGRPPDVHPAAVARARWLAECGLKPTAIARQLTREEFIPPRGEVWHRQTVHHMVTGQPWGSVSRMMMKEAV